MISTILNSFRGQVCRHRFSLTCMSTVSHVSESSNSSVLDTESSAPIIRSENLDFLPQPGRLRRAWIENIDSITEQKLGVIDLHPEVFAVRPRLDIINANLRWQQLYRKVNWTIVPNRAEMPGGGRKPWPQKGMGRARHGSIRSPIFRLGGKAHGPRAPKTYFYMLPFHDRLLGLTTTLSAKLAQDDLHIVKSLDLPTNDPAFIQDLVTERLWGPSVLFVDVSDVAPENIAMAIEEVKHMNIMPLYGLNVYSMLKYDTLILTLAAVEELQSKILFNLHRTDKWSKCAAFSVPDDPFKP